MSENGIERLTDYPELLTVEEVAGLLKTDLPGALDATGVGALRAIEIGTTIRRYQRQDVHNYLRLPSRNRAHDLG
jgi:hypothetical protein